MTVDSTCPLWGTIFGMDTDKGEKSRRTEAARKARHLNVLRRKAPEMIVGLQELDYFVVPPEDAKRVRALLQRAIESAARAESDSVCETCGRES